MEDDAYFKKTGPFNMELIINKIKHINWDILYLGHFHLHGKVINDIFVYPEYVDSQYDKLSYNVGFFGYIIKLTSLPKLISIISEFDRPYIDEGVRHRFGSNYNQISPLFLNSKIILHYDHNDYTSVRKDIDNLTS
jgi:hypothetical protein